MLEYPNPVTILIDGDSIAYEASYADVPFLVQRAVDNTMSRILLDCSCNREIKSRYRLFIESTVQVKGRRFETAVTREYKGNRKNREKPRLLAYAKKYMIKKWNAEVIRGKEVDDVVVDLLRQSPESYVLAHVDKDLLQVEGIFYNYTRPKKKLKWKGRFFTRLSKEEAEYNLSIQLLMGDTVDNIPGIPLIGIATAKKLLATSDNYMNDACLVYATNGLEFKYLKEQFSLLYVGDEWEQAFEDTCLSEEEFNKMRLI